MAELTVADRLRLVEILAPHGPVLNMADELARLIAVLEAPAGVRDAAPHPAEPAPATRGGELSVDASLALRRPPGNDVSARVREAVAEIEEAPPSARRYLTLGDRVLAFLGQHPWSSRSEIVAGLGSAGTAGGISSSIVALHRNGQVVSRGEARAWRYALAGTPEPEDQDPSEPGPEPTETPGPTPDVQSTGPASGRLLAGPTVAPERPPPPRSRPRADAARAVVPPALPGPRGETEALIAAAVADGRVTRCPTVAVLETTATLPQEGRDEIRRRAEAEAAARSEAARARIERGARRGLRSAAAAKGRRP